MSLLSAVMDYGMARQYALVDSASYLDDIATVTGPSVLFNFRPESLPMLSQRAKSTSDDASLTRERMTQLMSGTLLLLLARLSSLDLVVATGCRPERSAVQLNQLHQLVTRLRQSVLQAPGITLLLLSMYTLLKYAVQINDRNLFLGVSHLVTAFENLPKSKDMLHSVIMRKPDLLFHLSKQLLTHPDPGCGAVVTVLRHLPDQELINQLLKKLLTWAPSCTDVGRHSVDMDAGLDEITSHVGLVLDRISSLLQILQELAPKTLKSSPEVAIFVELCRGADVPLFLFDLLTFMTTPRRKQLMKKLSDCSALRQVAHLLLEQCPPPTNKLDVSHPARWHSEATGRLVVLMLQVLKLWLKSEHMEGATSLSSLLAITGNGDVSQLGVSLVALLDLCQDPEEDNTPLLSEPAQALRGPVRAYLDVAMEDEALIRPLCAALCQRLRCSGPETGGLYGVSHWKTRLAAIDVLRIVYEHLLQTDKLGSVSSSLENWCSMSQLN
ncbi:hypothetical protein Ciccas_009367 [Cichlidogyrus casuarinus]|uniref:Uncharacterized protein n=1 Tax=Cichlidogyrus casuarinus TaxID=1844966 RepID=A0ABD2PX89_9PLAT